MSSATPPGPIDVDALISVIASAQDRDAFIVLFGYFAPRLKAHLMRAGCAPGQAEELIQETMLSVWRKAAQFDRGRGVGAAWVYAIARNLRIDALRRERAADGAMFDLPPDEPAADEWLASSQAYAQLQAALVQLPADQAQVVRAAFVEHRSHAEIAEVLGLPLGTVKSRLRLALRRLRDTLEQER